MWFLYAPDFGFAKWAVGALRNGGRRAIQPAVSDASPALGPAFPRFLQQHGTSSGFLTSAPTPAPSASSFWFCLPVMMMIGKKGLTEVSVPKTSQPLMSGKFKSSSSRSICSLSNVSMPSRPSAASSNLVTFRSQKLLQRLADLWIIIHHQDFLFHVFRG